MRDILEIPRLSIAHLPTPIEKLARLSGILGGPQLLVKRDDQTGLALGGNKTRKLEFLLADAKTHGAQTLVTAGAAQSNHCRQTAAAAARVGFDCILVLAGEKPSTLSGNLLLDDLLGATIIWTSLSERDRMLKKTYEDAWDAGARPYLIPYGGSNTIGASAYAFAMKELVTQLENSPDLPYPDWIVFASSSGGTQAGLALGERFYGFHGKVLGISVDEHQYILQERVALLAKDTASMLGGYEDFSPDDILVNADYIGQGYGIVGEPEKEAVKLFARSEGLFLDPVYTGRAAAGMIDLIRKGFFSPSDVVLFWHTGGMPALFANQYSNLFT
jgi:D-cysteine desulfhydrase family pyridoxal phosphate-dependent enzyme